MKGEASPALLRVPTPCPVLFAPAAPKVRRMKSPSNSQIWLVMPDCVVGPADPRAIAADVLPSTPRRQVKVYVGVPVELRIPRATMRRSEERRVGKEGRSRWSPY